MGFLEMSWIFFVSKRVGTLINSIFGCGGPKPLRYSRTTGGVYCNVTFVEVVAVGIGTCTQVYVTHVQS